jgi:hypothetical protein
VNSQLSGDPNVTAIYGLRTYIVDDLLGYPVHQPQPRPLISGPASADDTLEDLPGVSRSHSELKAARSAVWLDTTRTDPRQVIETITGLGYTASVLS